MLCTMGIGANSGDTMPRQGDFSRTMVSPGDGSLVPCSYSQFELKIPDADAENADVHRLPTFLS